MPSPAQGSQGMNVQGRGRTRGRGRGRGGSRSANNSDNEGGRQSGRGQSSAPRGGAQRGAAQAHARGAAQNLRQALSQPGTPTGPKRQSQNRRGNTPRRNGSQSNAPATVPATSTVNASNPEDRWSQLRERRAKEREAAIAQGFIVDPDRPRSLADAVTPVGTCMDMCPEYERLRRITGNDVLPQELDPSTVDLPRDKRKVNESRMVKAFKRSAAGSDEQLPSDLRPPAVLQRTCKYLFNALLHEETQSLESAYFFIWDRSRAVRNDFSIQQLSKISDVRIAIECLEWIARFHILTLHRIGGLPREKRPERYDYYQDLEQLDKTLLSLINYYHNVRNHYRSPNEAEFRAYRIIYQMTTPAPNVEDSVQLWPAHVLRDPRVQRALKLYNAAQTIRQEQGPLAPRIGHPVAQANWNRFFRLVKSKQTSFLMSCVAEIYFNFVRHKALRAIWRGYRTGGEGRVSDGWSLDELAEALGFDKVDQVYDFVANYDFKIVQKDDDRWYLDVNSVGRTFPAPKEDRQEPLFSRTIVERKRYGRTPTAIINGMSVKAAFEAGMISGSYSVQAPTVNHVGEDSLRVNGAPVKSRVKATDSIFNQDNSSAAVHPSNSEPTNQGFSFSAQMADPNAPGGRKVNGDSLFVTDDSDEEQRVGTKQPARPASAPKPSSLVQFAYAFAASSNNAFTRSQTPPASNPFSAPPTTTNNFLTSATSSAHANVLSAATSSSTFSNTQSTPLSNIFATPTQASTSNTFNAQATSSASKPPIFSFTAGASTTAQPSTSAPIFSFPSIPAATITPSTMGTPSSGSSLSSIPATSINTSTIGNSQGSFSFPPIPTTTITTSDNNMMDSIKAGLPLPSSSSQLTQAATTQNSQISLNHSEQPEGIKHLFLRHITAPLKDYDPAITQRVMEQIKSWDTFERDSKSWYDAEVMVKDWEAAWQSSEYDYEKRRIWKDIMAARATRRLREERVRKGYVAAVEAAEREKRKALEAEREKTYAHYKGIRTVEVIRYLTRHLALSPKQPALGFIVGYHTYIATTAFRTELTTFEAEQKEREEEAQRVAERRAQQVEKDLQEKRRQQTHGMRQRKKAAIKREAEKAKKAKEEEEAAAARYKYSDAAFDAVLDGVKERMRIYGPPSSTTPPTTAAQQSLSVPPTTTETLSPATLIALSMTAPIPPPFRPRNSIATPSVETTPTTAAAQNNVVAPAMTATPTTAAAQQSLVTPATTDSRPTTGTQRSALRSTLRSADNGMRGHSSHDPDLPYDPQLLIKLMVGPPNPDGSLSTFKNPYFHLKAAGLAPIQRNQKRKRNPEEEDTYLPLEPPPPPADPNNPTPEEEEAKRDYILKVNGIRPRKMRVTTSSMSPRDRNAHVIMHLPAPAPTLAAPRDFGAQIAALRKAAVDLDADTQWFIDMSKRLAQGDKKLIEALEPSRRR